MGNKIVIFGTGHHGRAALRKCNRNKKFECVCFFDSNRKKHNTIVLKKKVYHITKINKNAIIIRSLNFGGIFIFKSSTRPKRKHNRENEIYSKGKIFLEKYK